ncbi:ABC transporter substrate-binding protein, partial [Desulfamplus magnetovallimortis]|uniref:ABC transporter substrate-binding protein n=1 Tax=Desulfamplus magnetovallimortis TaxID=1246637 RepID=UPI0011182156
MLFVFNLKIGVQKNFFFCTRQKLPMNLPISPTFIVFLFFLLLYPSPLISQESIEKTASKPLPAQTISYNSINSDKQSLTPKLPSENIPNGKKKPSILVLHSYHKGLTWTDTVAQGIDETLERMALVDKKKSLNPSDQIVSQAINISHEFMDTKRIATPEYLNQLAALYKTHYAACNFDAIITSDDHAFQFMLKHGSQIFLDTPVIFCGVNNFTPEMLNDRPLFTGVVESIDMAKTLEIAFQLNPNSNHIVAILDNSLSGKANKELFLKAIKALAQQTKVTWIDNHTMDEVKDYVNGLGKNDIVIWLHFTSDSQGNFYTFHQSARIISDASNSPLYSFWDFHLGYGIVGGMLTSGYHQGKTAAELAIRVLNNEKPSSIPVILESPNQYMFDANELKRFDIPISKLPAGSIVINQPVSFYTQNRQLVWFTIILMCSLIAIILLLSINMLHRKKSMKNLAQSEARFRQLFTHSPGGMAMVSIKGNYMRVNDAFCTMLGYTQSEMKNMHWSQVTHPDDIELTYSLIERMRKILGYDNKNDNKVTYKSESLRLFKIDFSSLIKKILKNKQSGLSSATPSHENDTKYLNGKNHEPENIDLETRLNGNFNIFSQLQPMEKRYVKRNGETVWALISAAPITNIS